MDNEQTIDYFVDLFRGNGDYYGTNDGGCVEATHEWPRVAEWHLTGELEPIGVYPAFPYGHETICYWGCVDFDEGWSDSFVHAKNLRAVLSEFAIRSWIERSRSKGYHVWIFMDMPAKAATVRRALLAACQIAGAPTKEINPKQENLQAGQVGNYVRLPYPGALTKTSGTGQFMVTPDGKLILVQHFCEAAWEDRNDLDEVADLSELYIPPRVLTPKRDWTKLDGSKYDRLRGMARTIFEHGPRSDQPITDADGYNNGRSSRLWKLACTLRENAEHSFDEAVELLLEADERWGKFSERGDQAEVHALAAKAWGLTT